MVVLYVYVLFSNSTEYLSLIVFPLTNIVGGDAGNFVNLFIKKLSFLKMHSDIKINKSYHFVTFWEGGGTLALCHLMPNKSHNLLSVYTAPPLELHDQLLCN